MMRKDISDTAMFQAERHPDFDKAWADHEMLIYWWANRLTWIMNRAWGGKKHWCAEDFYGYLTIRLNYILHHYDPDKGTFATLFSYSIVKHVLRSVIEMDTEPKTIKMLLVDQEEAQRNKAYHESDYFMYRIPENESWAEQILELCGPDPWEFLMRNVPPRSKTIIEMLYRCHVPWEAVAKEFGVSRTRIGQIVLTTKKRIRDRLEKLELVRELFYGAKS